MSSAGPSHKEVKLQPRLRRTARQVVKPRQVRSTPVSATKDRRKPARGTVKRPRSGAAGKGERPARKGNGAPSSVKAGGPLRARKRAADRPWSAAKAAARRRALLRRKINQLALKIPGTRLEKLINRLYDELERVGIHFRPRCYLADEWGCPDNVPVIGIPFYLADSDLSRLEGDITGVEAEDESEVLMYLRHEAGHAFNYAYRLYKLPEWRRTFGSYRQAYDEDFKAAPFSTRYVRNVPGWYSQKHPDEDFAETFAVYVRPNSDWRERYAGTPALQKLLYVKRLVRKYGRKPPLVNVATLDSPVEQMDMTLAEWYSDPGQQGACNLPALIDEDIRALFPADGGQPALKILRDHRRGWVRELHHWTGMSRHQLEALFEELLRRTEALRLRIEPDQADERLVDAAIFLTTLAMNYQYTGKYAGE